MSEPTLRDELFPDGQPEPEELIRELVFYIRQQLGLEEPERQRSEELQR